MPNLLSEKNKKEISREFILRFIILILAFIFLTVSVAIALLFPSRIITNSREVSISDEIKIFKQTIDFRKQDSPIDILNDENIKINIIKKNKDVYISDFISEIVKIKPAGIKIKGFFYEVSSKDEENVLIIRGKSKNRNILISFIEDLEKKSIFSKIDFPVSNLVKDESFDFSIKIYPKDF